MFFTFVLKVALFKSRVPYETTNDFLLLQCIEFLELVPVLVSTAGSDERRLYRGISPAFASQILRNPMLKQCLEDQKKNSYYE